MKRDHGRRPAPGLRIAALAAVLPLVLAGCGGSSGDGGTISWRLAETHPEGHPTVEADQWFADELRERSNGRIDVTVYTDAQLGEERDVLEQIQLGSVEMTRTNANLVAEFVPTWEAFGMPYIFDGPEHFWAFLESEEGTALMEDLSEGGFTGLAYYDSGARSFYTTEQPVEEPSDLEGQNIRVQPGSLTAEAIEAMGGSATAMDFSEVYSGMETGVIDGAENNLPSYVSTMHYEVAPEIALNEHQRVPEVLLVGESVWQSLSEEDRELVREVAAESSQKQRELWAEETERSRGVLEENGVEIHEVEDKDPFREALAGVREAHEDDLGEALDAIEAARP
ncbi:tripartite ATP-independent transporter DctP family solute receptor [Spinactinospora alkalitolerans]|uniref:Tripartite ATP-independent transporter DctP family solute receptor n=1 Tax=Spinactinospora alkalitolerans TaxID=687207 RepID=A0A852U3R6_9ACTN|nr:TRAP transporter substrate-binding protein [Spinactinospora alkalitolerans]NYE50135.1 tripartite ATP-independent transporter DctP family solute receptor [Spinactinospora alkalitolerans]